MDPRLLQAYPSLAAKCANTTLVLPDTLQPRQLCIVGESLGEDEVLNMQYFCGRAGSLLNKLLADVGLIRPTIHITNLVKVRPPDNDLTRLGELSTDKTAFLPQLTIEDFVPYLKEELLHVAPKVILVVGRYAMQYLCKLTGITKWRGSVVHETLTGKQITTIITFHPAYLLRGNMDMYVYVRNDFRRFAQFAFGLRNEMVPMNQVIDPTLTQAIDYLHDIYTNSTETSLDIETVARQRITCIGFTKNPEDAICIPFRHKGLKFRWQKHEFVILLNAIREVWSKPGLVKIGQNINYDLHYMQPLVGYPREPIADTRFMHHLIHPDAPHDLGFIMSNYTDMPYHKDEAKDMDMKSIIGDDVLWIYNTKDTIGTHRAYLNLKRDLIELGLWDFFTGYVMPFRRVIFDMEHNGLRVDVQERDEWIKFIQDEELPIALAEIEKLTGRKLNPNSSPQIGAYLKEVHNIRVPVTDAGNYSMTEDKLEQLAARLPHLRSLIQTILCARVLKAKDLGTYLAAPLEGDRLHTTYGIAVTGRLTSSTNHKGYGTNVQNMPKKFRHLVLPEPGHKFTECDLSQAEARWMAWLMRSNKLKAIFKSGQKIHKIMGGEIYGKSPEKLTQAEYDLAKRTVHGSNYDMGPIKFATLIQKTVAEAKVIQATYHQLLPELRVYHAWVREQLNTTGRLTTPYGRVRPMPKMLNDEDYRSGYSYIPQSGVVDTLNIGMLSLWLIKPDYMRIPHQGHDSLLISMPESDFDWFKPFIKMHLETLREVTINNEILVVPIDIGNPKDTWGGNHYELPGTNSHNTTTN